MNITRQYKLYRLGVTSETSEVFSYLDGLFENLEEETYKHDTILNKTHYFHTFKDKITKKPLIFLTETLYVDHIYYTWDVNMMVDTELYNKTKIKEAYNIQKIIENSSFSKLVLIFYLGRHYKDLGFSTENDTKLIKEASEIEMIVYSNKELPEIIKNKKAELLYFDTIQ